ncbi:hypothetical protein [Corallococcus carmarthensis]|uniref:Uncharacterized protein n=1 Tax=Corallococcus carmarthensis TaxID=2316728 RepID=A0A3A8JWD8_9BACT|nr:hypothetical protein [Corallococcus carmarthensis]RKG99198.1 hypothetical protein D7X32_27100 [Corallococcus carmarthensis]
MAYLTLSGIEVRCSAAKGLTQKPTLLGPRVRTFRGWAQSGTRARVYTWSAGTPPMPMTDAQALRRLLDGDGHSWTFADATANSFTSSKGAVPSSLNGVPQAGTAIPGRWGNGAMFLNPGEEVTWAIGTRLDCTVGFWLRTDYVGSNWTHVVACFKADALYVNGSELGIVDDMEGELGLVVSVSEGVLSVLAAADVAVSDLVYLPYTVPPAWVPQWAAATAPFGPLPYHTADGYGLPAPCRVLGQAGDAQAVEYDEDGARVQGQYLDFELWQQPEDT